MGLVEVELRKETEFNCVCELSMENMALKQRLESLAQEQLIKYCKFLF